MKWLIDFIEFVIALIIVILIFYFVPINCWLFIVGVAICTKIVWYMFSTRNLERHGRRGF